MLVVFRLVHRPFRDQRISTHCGLVARAFGADKLVYSGQKDDGLEKSIGKVVDRFGGKFKIEFVESWRKALLDYKRKGFKIVHLTVYGLDVQKTIGKVRKHKKLVVVIGGEKVPWEVYRLADHNVSVASQPHSEVAALAVFLDRYFGGKELGKNFRGKLKIIPQERGKMVESAE